MNCSKCQKKIHPLRIKILPHTKVCVKCSKTGAYKGVVTTHGTGDHTWNDLAILTAFSTASAPELKNAALHGLCIGTRVDNFSASLI